MAIDSKDTPLYAPRKVGDRLTPRHGGTLDDGWRRVENPKPSIAVNQPENTDP